MQASADPALARDSGKTDDLDLPHTQVKKIIKAKLARLEAGKKSVDPQKPQAEVQISKDAVLACAESAKVFISYITATANDICLAGKRQTISATDVLTAIEDAQLIDLIGPLKQSLEAYRAETKAKQEQNKKRKREKEEASRGASSAQPGSQPSPGEAAAGVQSPSGASPHQPGQSPAGPSSSRPPSGFSPSLLLGPGDDHPALVAPPAFALGASGQQLLAPLGEGLGQGAQDMAAMHMEDGHEPQPLLH